MISFAAVSKTYKPGLFKPKVQGVRELSLEVHQGEVFGLVGPNGAGKSTSIKLLLGLMRPDRGDIRFEGRPLDVSDFRHRIGYLPENPYLYDHLSLRELFRFGGRSFGMSASAIEERGRDLADRLGLAEVQRRPLRTFSKGMLQKAAIGFTLLHDPEIVILDEPMSGLDPLGRRLIFDLILELKGRGRTIFFCSHILSDVERLCDRIGFMNRGRLAKVLVPGELARDRVQILIASASDGLLEDLAQAGAACSAEGSLTRVTAEVSALERITTLLQEHRAAIQDLRREAFSLEDLFLEIVEEQRHVA